MSADGHTSGTGKWRRPGVPHKGWQCIDIEDLEEPCHVCEMCEVQIVRYVHTMFHPDYGTLEVGCICAGYMEQDLVGARTVRCASPAAANAATSSCRT
jgi:hypothetical protein